MQWLQKLFKMFRSISLPNLLKQELQSWAQAGGLGKLRLQAKRVEPQNRSHQKHSTQNQVGRPQSPQHSVLRGKRTLAPEMPQRREGPREPGWVPAHLLPLEFLPFADELNQQPRPLQVVPEFLPVLQLFLHGTCLLVLLPLSKARTSDCGLRPPTAPASPTCTMAAESPAPTPPGTFPPSFLTP